MTTKIALWIAGVLLAILAVDLALDLGIFLFLARRFLDLLAWVAFWR